MSGLLAGKVWLSALEAHLKPLAATLADIANDDGTSIYPTIAYVAWRLGAVERTVQRGLSELVSLGVLVKEADAYHHRPTEYRLVEHALPKRDSWSLPQPKKRGVKLSPQKPETGVTSTTDRGDIYDSQGRHLEQLGVTFEADLLPLSLNDPSVDPLLDPSERESAPLALRTPHDLVAIWNAHREPGPKVQDLTPKRQRLYAQAIHARPRDTDWLLAIAWLNAQAYCNARGTGEHPTWRATLDWLAKPSQIGAVLEQARTDEIAPPRRPRRVGDLPSDGLTEADRDRSRRAEESRRAMDALADQAAALVLTLSEPARCELEREVLADVEQYRSRMTPSAFDDLVLRTLPKALIDRAHGQPLTEVVDELERKATAA